MNIEDYENKIPYPTKPVRPHIGVKPTSAQAKEYASLMEKYEADSKEWKKLYAVYSEEDARIVAKFKQDALEELGLSDYPLKDEFFEFFWNYGHSYGYNELWLYMKDARKIIMWNDKDKVKK